jgi:hypothetical protein
MALNQGFPTLVSRIHLSRQRGFCGSAEELQKNKHTTVVLLVCSQTRVDTKN